MSRFVTPFAGVSVFTDGKLSSSTGSVVDAGAASGYQAGSSVARHQDMSRFVTSFAGVSVFTDGMLSSSTRSVVDAGADSGYHLLVVDGYSQTKRFPNGLGLRCRPFIVGGHRWSIDYLPNGSNPYCADYISLCVVFLDDNVAEYVKVWFRFSFIDEVEKQEVTLIRAASTSSFCSNDKTWGELRFIKRDVLEQSKNLKNDRFTIRFDIMICKDFNTENAGATEVPLSGIGQHFNHLLQTKVGADVTFEVSGETFAAHRCVLAARSTVFMAQLFGCMKEGTEADVIQIKDMKAKVFKALLSFIYTDAFPEMEVNTKAVYFEMWLQWLEDLIVAADRYDLQHLRFSCEYLLCDAIGATSVLNILDLAVQHHCLRAKEACLQFLQDLSSSSLQELMATNSWKHIILAYPYVLNELIAKLAAKCNASGNATSIYPYSFLFPPSGNSTSSEASSADRSMNLELEKY
ncbi:unnamed protein product [Alopecurus aequalis]